MHHLQEISVMEQGFVKHKLTQLQTSAQFMASALQNQFRGDDYL